MREGVLTVANHRDLTTPQWPARRSTKSGTSARIWLTRSWPTVCLDSENSW